MAYGALPLCPRSAVSRRVRMRRALPLACLMGGAIFSLCACGESSADSPAGEGSTAGDAAEASAGDSSSSNRGGSTTTVRSQESLYSLDAPKSNPSGEMAPWVYDETQVRTYELSLPAPAWEELKANAQDEEYTEADLVVEDQQLFRVGLRFKGGVGTLVSCFESGERVCDKLSMKIDISEYLPEQRLFGLKRLTFNSMIWDPSHMHDRLAYRLFREMGVIAPRSVHARLVVNGEDLGLFALVETIDGRFTKDRFSEGDGNLYKEMWPDSDDPERLAEQLKTNEDEADHSGILDFYTDLQQAEASELPQVVANHMDVEALYAYLAVDDSIRNWDGVTGFFCYNEDGTDCRNHNYYLYQHEEQSRFTLIPWDLDSTFELITPLGDVPVAMVLPEDCSRQYPAFNRSVLAPACDRLIGGLARGDRERYRAHLSRLLDGPFAEGVAEGWIDEWQAQLEPEVETDDNGPGLDPFRSAVEALRLELVDLRARAREQLDAL